MTTIVDNVKILADVNTKTANAIQNITESYNMGCITLDGYLDNMHRILEERQSNLNEAMDSQDQSDALAVLDYLSLATLADIANVRKYKNTVITF